MVVLRVGASVTWKRELLGPAISGGFTTALALTPGAWLHARSRHTLEQAFDFGRAAREFVTPKVVARIFDQLYEGDEQSPRVQRRPSA